MEEAAGPPRSLLRSRSVLVFFLIIGDIYRPHSSADAFQSHVLLSTSSRRTASLQLARRRDDDISVLLKSSNQNDDTITPTQEGEDSDSNEQLDTIRVRIWRQLADGKELSLSQLSNAVGERRLGELRSHLTHVEKQAKTIRNKSHEWRIRRGLSPVVGTNDAPRKLKLKFRKGKKRETFVRIV